MGYIRHNALIVISGNREDGQLAHQKATELFGDLVTPIIFTRLGGDSSFLVAPDGSKEGWDVSNDHDQLRKTFCDFLDSLAYEDGSNSISFADVALDEEQNVAIDRSNKQEGEMFE